MIPIELPDVGRDRLPAMFAGLGFTTGAEIGVWEGAFSETLCRAIPGLQLLCVDAWTPYGGPETQCDAADPVFARRVAAAYETALARLAPYGCTLLRAFSVDAASAVHDRSLDFVYIDGAHDFDHVITDLVAWTPKVRSGGIVSGHDYAHFPRHQQIRVVEAVDAYTRAHDIDPWFVLAGDPLRSFYWVQP